MADCPNEKCSNQIVIEKNWTAGGFNDYGGLILKCGSCGHDFDLYVGRDIDCSRVLQGAKKLASYDRDIDGDREKARKRCGLPPPEHYN